MSSLYVRRKTDRAVMAQKIVDLTRTLGAFATVTKEGQSTYNNRCVRISIETTRGLCVTVSLDGASSQPDVFVLPWYVKGPSDATLSSTFALAVSATVNIHHRQKATAVAYGFEDLYSTLEAGIDAAMTGTAFETTANEANKNT